MLRTNVDYFQHISKQYFDNSMTTVVKKGITFKGKLRRLIMLREIIASILIPAFLIQVAGCYSEQPIEKESLRNSADNKIMVVTSDRKEYTCEPDFWSVRNDTLFLIRYDSTKNKITRKIPFSSIRLTYENRFDLPETILAGIGILFVAVIVIGIAEAFHSMPFGHQYN